MVLSCYRYGRCDHYKDVVYWNSGDVEKADAVIAIPAVALIEPSFNSASPVHAASFVSF